MVELNFQKCKSAMQNIYVSGLCNSKVRQDAIEEAISAIQSDPNSALLERYIGVKNYAHFGDQGVNCEYGMGPRHGHVVFRIARHRSHIQKPLGDNEIYLLESCRDFKGFNEGIGKEPLDLCSVVRAITNAQVAISLKGSCFEDVHSLVSPQAIAAELKELERCSFECEAGPLSNHKSFQNLMSISQAA